MKNAIHVTFIILVAIIFTGCATIFKGTSQDIVIKSTPEKAHVNYKIIEWRGNAFRSNSNIYKVAEKEFIYGVH